MTEENNNNPSSPSSPSDLPVVSINFDRRLPVLHSYLGDLHQGELLFESLYEEPNTQLKVPVLLMGEVCLLPGQKLPLKLYARTSIEFMSDPIRQRSYFALFTRNENVLFQNAQDFSRISCHSAGTLFQILLLLYVIL
ncbi:unnamed protein product [Meloidogyne enterolobii]|uniref:Uncharacterized protein n=1 Tax=Meloidogyne enterolobii TaxID=390850 RepID=A0ACB1AL51_MELEN